MVSEVMQHFQREVKDLIVMTIRVVMMLNVPYRKKLLLCVGNKRSKHSGRKNTL